MSDQIKIEGNYLEHELQILSKLDEPQQPINHESLPVIRPDSTISIDTSFAPRNTLKLENFSVNPNLSESFDSSSRIEELPTIKADFVFVYHDQDEKKTGDGERKQATTKANNAITREIYLKNLENYGLEIEIIRAANHVVYVLLRTPFHILLTVAENLKVKLPIQV